MRILIAENQQHVVFACRRMAEVGHEIIFASPLVNNRLERRFFSKSYSKKIAIKKKEGIERIRQIKQIYEKEKCDVFYPFGYNLVTAYMEAVHSDCNLEMKTPYGDYYSYWMLSDKAKLYDTLKKADILLPKLYAKIKAKEKIELDEDIFPVIVKRSKGVGIKANVILATNIDEVNEFINNTNPGEFIVQQYISGFIFDVGGFAVNGEIYYAVPQKRTITYPLGGGVAAVNDIYDDPKLIKLASNIIETAGWSGPFQTEFRQDPKTKQYYLLEVNAKMWGSSPLSIIAGNGLLDIALKTACQTGTKKDLSFNKKLRYRWICGQELLAVSDGKLEDIREFIKRFFSKSIYDFEIKDIGPDFLRLAKSISIILFFRKKMAKSLKSSRR